jgi:hypothetical protein
MSRTHPWKTWLLNAGIAFAQAGRDLDLSRSTICNVFNGRQKNFSDAVCERIEAYTKGEISFRTLRLWSTGGGSDET